jgi:uncharacterized protein (TIGR02284 family)
MDDVIAALARLHTEVIDARNGYAEAIRLAKDPEMTAIFRDLHDLHARHAEALAAALGARGARADDDGSFMSLVHKAVLNVRAAVSGLDENVLPAIIDGEERLLDSYDEALKAAEADPSAQPLLLDQTSALNARLASLEAKVGD